MEKNLGRVLVVAGAALLIVGFYYREKIVEKIVEMIKKFEGFSATPYNDPVGSDKFSIGYGHQILPGENIKSVTVTEAEMLLAADTQLARNTIARLVRVPLNADQTAALVSFVYNIGSGAFERGTVPAKLNAGDFAAAGATMQHYNKSGGKVDAGLIARRAVESKFFV